MHGICFERGPANNEEERAEELLKVKTHASGIFAAIANVSKLVREQVHIEYFFQKRELNVEITLVFKICRLWHVGLSTIFLSLLMTEVRGA